MMATAPTSAAATAFLRRRSGITSYESDRRKQERDDGVQQEHEQPGPRAEGVPFRPHRRDDLAGVVREVLRDRIVPARRQEVHDDRYDEQQAEQRRDRARRVAEQRAEAEPEQPDAGQEERRAED